MCSWSPPWWRVALYAVAGCAALAYATAEPVSLAVAGILLGIAARDALSRPALEADPEALAWRSGLRRHSAGWSRIEHVGASRESRRGLVLLRSLEIDLGDQLVILSGHQLGADPDVVARALAAYLPRRFG